MDSIGDIIEGKAAKDGRFAVAYALLLLTDALRDMGFGRRPDGVAGTTEMIAMNLGRIADALENIQAPSDGNG